jgi:hypothetical protein
MDIVFHKTHKTSSSTIQNILFRHAMKNNLNVAIDKDGFLGTSSGFKAISLASQGLLFRRYNYGPGGSKMQECKNAKSLNSLNAIYCLRR